MKFEDFGIKDESELEQDEFSLGRPTFGKDNQLTVIGWKGKIDYHKQYVVKCHQCSQDPELFGDGVFSIAKSSLLRGTTACGCSKQPRWTEDQYKTLIRRESKDRGYLFHGFSGNFKRQKTKLKLGCPKHGIWETTSIDGYLISKYGCSCCQKEKVKNILTKEKEYHINNFINTGKFKEGTKFWRSNRLDTRYHKAYWNYICPICSNDEYVKEGLCYGVFEGHLSCLSKGKLSCRCSTSYRWTPEQYEYKIKKKMVESGTTDEFIGFVGEFKNQNTKIHRNCKIHGIYKTSISKFLGENQRCPLCGYHSQQECYINFIKENDSVVALKFGIAKDSEQRIKNQNRKSTFTVEQHGVWKFPDVKSCKAAERYIKKHLPCRFLTKDQMTDGYTETTSPENLDYIINVFEKYGGVRKIVDDKENLIENNNKNKEAA